MSRLRVWLFTAVVGLALAANLVLLSPHVVQEAEEGLRARLSLASSGLRGQLELVDARLAPRGLAQNAELLETLRAPDPSVPAARPDERALRAAAAVLSPEPDLLVVANGAGAVVSRRGKPAAALDDLAALGPLRKVVDTASGRPGFVEVDKQLYRVAAARAPGGAGVVLTGALIDDRFAQQQKNLLDADLAFFEGSSLSASSLPPGPRRDDLVRWQRAKGAVAGYGALPVRLPLVGHRFDAALPLGTSGFATRAVLVPLDGAVQAAVSLPAGPALAWFARYQALYAVGLSLLLLLGLLWGLFFAGSAAAQQPDPDRSKPPADRSSSPPPEEGEPEVGPVRRRPRSVERGDPAVGSVTSLLGADVSPPEEPGKAKLGARDVPWSPAFEDTAQWSGPGAVARPSRTNGAAPDGPENDPAPKAEEREELHAGLGAEGAAEAGGGSSDPEWASAASAASPGRAAADPAPAPRRSEAPPREFSFSDLHDPSPGAPASQAQPALDLQRAEADAEAGGEPPSGEMSATLHGAPGADLLAQAREAGAPDDDAFAGDEPTRIQPISAALLEKLREKDDAGAAGPAEDPDEAHFRETFDQFLALRAQTGEGQTNVTYEKFAARLRKNREDLLAKHGARGVRFAVYVKEGKAAIKASTTR